MTNAPTFQKATRRAVKARCPVKTCGRLFPLGQAMGSHIARAHRNRLRPNEFDKFIRLRFAQHVFPGVLDECWEWGGNRLVSGYGVFRVLNRQLLAHRTMYEFAHGSIPPGRWVVMHSCDNPPCVNPAHLSLGTDLDNHRDRIAKGRPHGRQLYPERWRSA